VRAEVIFAASFEASLPPFAVTAARSASSRHSTEA
jgi:hypothetical protein